MNFKFFKAYTGVKVDDFFTLIQKQIIQADLSGASAAQLDMYDQKMAELAQKVVQAQAEYEKEQNEADSIRQTYNMQVAAIGKMKAKMDATTDDAEKESLRQSLVTFTKETTDLQAKVKQEQQEAEDAKSIFETYKDTLAMVRNKLTTARQSLATAQSRIAKAKADEERSQELLNSRKEEAGLRTNGNDIDVVLTQMDKIASKSEEQAKANRVHADALVPETPKVDANVASAMAEVTGASTPGNDLDSQIASLKPM